MQYDPSYYRSLAHTCGNELRAADPERAAHFVKRTMAELNANPFAERDRLDRERLARHKAEIDRDAEWLSAG